MKNKKGQLGTTIIGIGVVLIIGVIIASIMYSQVDNQTSQTTVTDDQFTASNSSCVDITDKCIYSVTSVENGTGSYTVTSGNYSTCKVNSGLRWDDGLLVSDDLVNGQTLNATYTEIDCGYISSGLTRTIVNYLPVLLAVALLIFLAGYVTMKS